jgi:hypothetical protein
VNRLSWLFYAFGMIAGASLSWSQGYTMPGGGGALTSPVATDPLSFTGVITFDNAANTPVTAGDGVRLPNGTAAAPSLSFTTATNAGIYHSAGVELSSGGAYVAGAFAGGFHVGNNGQLWLGASTTDTDTGFTRTAAGIAKVTNGSTGGGNLIIGASILTASTMTAETTAQARSVTSSYLWTNAMVAALAGTAGEDPTSRRCGRDHGCRCGSSHRHGELR